MQADRQNVLVVAIHISNSWASTTLTEEGRNTEKKSVVGASSIIGLEEIIIRKDSECYVKTVILHLDFSDIVPINLIKS